MSENTKPTTGSVGWIDLTVEDADAVRDFYKEVVGWTVTPLSMGDYDDYCMNTPVGEVPTAGVCHARGGNADMPAQWMLYINVDDLDRSIARCEELGGSLLTKVKNMPGQGRYCVIRDPAGAVTALFEAVG